MITERDVEVRLERLNGLALGLARELAIWHKGNDPLLHLERTAYLHAIADVLAGAEAARVVLARVLQRLRPKTREEP